MAAPLNDVRSMTWVSFLPLQDTVLNNNIPDILSSLTGPLAGGGRSACARLLPGGGAGPREQVLHHRHHSQAPLPVCGEGGRGLWAAGLQHHLQPEPGPAAQFPGVPSQHGLQRDHLLHIQASQHPQGLCLDDGQRSSVRAAGLCQTRLVVKWCAGKRIESFAGFFYVKF